MEFAYSDILRREVGFLECGLCGVLCHSETYEVDGAPVEKGWVVCGQTLAGNEYGLGFEVWSSVKECLGDDDRGSAAVRCGAALEFRKGFMYLG